MSYDVTTILDDMEITPLYLLSEPEPPDYMTDEDEQYERDIYEAARALKRLDPDGQHQACLAALHQKTLEMIRWDADFFE